MSSNVNVNESCFCTGPLQKAARGPLNCSCETHFMNVVPVICVETPRPYRPYPAPVQLLMRECPLVPPEISNLPMSPPCTDDSEVHISGFASRCCTALVECVQRKCSLCLLIFAMDCLLSNVAFDLVCTIMFFLLLTPLTHFPQLIPQLRLRKCSSSCPTP